MLTKPSAELTLFDTLSRLTFTRAAKLLGPKGSRLIATSGKFDIDLTTQVKFDREMFRLTLDGRGGHADFESGRPPSSRMALRRVRGAV
jgi:hypothetical protein